MLFFSTKMYFTQPAIIMAISPQTTITKDLITHVQENIDNGMKLEKLGWFWNFMCQSQVHSHRIDDRRLYERDFQMQRDIRVPRVASQTTRQLVIQMLDSSNEMSGKKSMQVQNPFRYRFHGPQYLGLWRKQSVQPRDLHWYHRKTTSRAWLIQGRGMRERSRSYSTMTWTYWTKQDSADTHIGITAILQLTQRQWNSGWWSRQNKNSSPW